MDSTQHDNQTFAISVVIPAYNISKLVARAIDSVLAQTHQPDEIIVVDDGSTDDTADIIKSYGSKVIYIYQENLGLAGARNTGIKNATCEWVAFLDQYYGEPIGWDLHDKTGEPILAVLARKDKPVEGIS